LHGAARAVTIDAASTTPKTPVTISLRGTLKGSYNQGQPNPDVGVNFTFFGHGTVKHVGKADVTGNAHQLGFIATGRAGGLLVISTPRGSLTLSLEGPQQKGFASLPDKFSYNITDASGKYRHVQGHGQVVLVLAPAGPGADRGTFTMVFI
jgi:hypothetical protein